MYVCRGLLYISDCISDWSYSPQSGRCYKHVNSSLSWAEARRTCQAAAPQGGDLASAPDEATNDFLARLTSDHVWLGGRRSEAGAWAWSDGAPWESWQHREPSEGEEEASAEHHLSMNYNGTGEWTEPTGFICQYNPSASTHGGGMRRQKTHCHLSLTHS